MKYNFCFLLYFITTKHITPPRNQGKAGEHKSPRYKALELLLILIIGTVGSLGNVPKSHNRTYPPSLVNPSLICIAYTTPYSTAHSGQYKQAGSDDKRLRLRLGTKVGHREDDSLAQLSLNLRRELPQVLAVVAETHPARAYNAGQGRAGQGRARWHACGINGLVPNINSHVLVVNRSTVWILYLIL